MEHTKPGSRGSKMLGMLGIRLRKKNSDESDDTLWKVVPCSDNPDKYPEPQTIEEETNNYSKTNPNNMEKEIYNVGEKRNNMRKDTCDTEKETNKDREETTNGGGETNTMEEDTCNVNEETNNGAQKTNSMENETNNMGKETNTAEREMNNMEDDRSDSSYAEDEPFSSDDSIADPNYLSSTSSSSSDDRVPLSPLKENEIEKKRTRKRKAVPSEWKRNKSKLLRNSGQAYTTLNKGEHVGARQMQMPCDNNCKHKCATKFSEQERLALFKMYWDLGDIAKQRSFLAIMVQEIHPKYTYPILINGKRKRTNNNAFYFEKDNKKVRVCKVFFVSTLGITSRCIRSFIGKRRQGDFVDNRGKHGKQQTVPDNVKNDVRAHIASIPKVESHYTRAHSEKEYIEGGKTITDLYRDYKSACEQESKQFASLTMYRNIFNYEFNLAFFVPKKDQCQRCVAYENANSEERKEMEEAYLQHIKEKQLSRADKQADKDKSNEQYVVSRFDLQATLPTPRGDVSTFYYKSKLSTYNFTVCDLTDKGQGSVTCFMWHEGQGKRGPNEIGSCLLHYLKQKSEISRAEELEIVFYSDNCSGQQKNKFVLAAYFYAIAKYNIKSITHKYLVSGHTQNEGDNVHSVIEKNIK